MTERQNVSRRQYAPFENAIYQVTFGLTTNSSGQFSITVPPGFFTATPKIFLTVIRDTTVVTDFTSAFLRSITDLGGNRYQVNGSAWQFTTNFRPTPAPAGIRVDMLLVGL